MLALLRAISTGVGRGVGAGRAGVGCVRACVVEERTGVGVGRGCVVVFATVSTGVDCVRGVGGAAGEGADVPASLFAV